MANNNDKLLTLINKVNKTFGKWLDSTNDSMQNSNDDSYVYQASKSKNDNEKDYQLPQFGKSFQWQNTPPKNIFSQQQQQQQVQKFSLFNKNNNSDQKHKFFCYKHYQQLRKELLCKGPKKWKKDRQNGKGNQIYEDSKKNKNENYYEEDEDVDNIYNKTFENMNHKLAPIQKFPPETMQRFVSVTKNNVLQNFFPVIELSFHVFATFVIGQILWQLRDNVCYSTNTVAKKPTILTVEKTLDILNYYRRGLSLLDKKQNMFPNNNYNDTEKFWQLCKKSIILEEIYFSRIINNVISKCYSYNIDITFEPGVYLLIQYDCEQIALKLWSSPLISYLIEHKNEAINNEKLFDIFWQCWENSKLWMNKH